MSSVLAIPSRPYVGRAQRSAAVAMARTSGEASLVHQLRYRVYVHEQGRRPDGLDRKIRSVTDSLVLCMPDRVIARMQRRYPESASCLKEVLRQSTTGSVLR